jgi:DNA replication and repair protein RecF
LRRGIFTKELLESFEETLALTGARIVVRRRDLVRSLAPIFAKVFGEIHGELSARIGYRSDARIEAVEGEEAIREALRLGLEAERASDQRRGFTGFGPQTDDLDMFLGDHLAREHGSQGQVRSLVLAFKIAELLHAEAQNQETPVLLLDDVSSELDTERRSRLFETISAMACQTLITVTERDHLPDLPGRVDWLVSGGQVERV